LGEIKIPLQPLPEQKRIVAILDKAFEGINTAIANTEKNLANARELFTGYLSRIFADEQWDRKTVSEIASHDLGKMLDQRKNRGKLQPYVRNINVRWFEFNLDDLLQMPFEDSERERYSARKGDVLICEGGYPGRAAIWNSDEPIFLQKAIHRVRFKIEDHSKWFLYFIYLADLNGELRTYFTGAGIQHFTGQALHRFCLPIPPRDVIKAYVSKFDQLFDQTRGLESIYRKKIEYLRELKQSILQRAFAGELTAHVAADTLKAAE